MAEIAQTIRVSKSTEDRRFASAPFAAVGIVFVGAVLIGLLQGPKIFYGDSGEYWTLASSFVKHGNFSLLNFDNAQRGYVLPLFNYGLNALGQAVDSSPSSAVTVFNAFLFSLIGAVLAPRLAEYVWPGHRWGIERRIVLVALLIIFWSGDLNYQLTDFPGLAMALLALVAIANPDTPGWMLIAGVAGGVAINLRPAYLPFLAMLLVIVVWAWFDQRRISHASSAHRALCLGLMFVGFAVVSLPQSLAAHRHYNSWSFVPGARANLTEFRLTTGLVNQRSDTYEGPEGPSALFYSDQAGQRLLERQPEERIKSSSQYLELIVDHPIVMVALLARHIVNGLDVRYSTIYVEHFDSGGHILLRLAGFLLVFLALVRVLWPTARRDLGPARWRYLLALASCSLTSVPTAIETRYMLPVYLLVYILVVAPGWPNPIGPAGAGIRRFRTPAVLAVAYVVFTAVVWHVVSGVRGHVV